MEETVTGYDLKEGDMHTLVYEIYSQIPKEVGANKVIPLPENENDIKDDFLIFIFQMLIEFYAEGICHSEKLKSIINRKKNNNDVDYHFLRELMKYEKYDNINFKNINQETLLYPEEWINSLGFRLNVTEERYEDYNGFINDENLKDNYYMGNQYCKVIFKYNTRDTMYFEYKGVKKPYHFLINNNFNKDKLKNISDLYALIFQNSLKNEKEYKVYKISFSEIKIIKDCHGKSTILP